MTMDQNERDQLTKYRKKLSRESRLDEVLLGN